VVEGVLVEEEEEDEVMPFLTPFIIVDPYVCNFGPRRLIVLLFILWFGLFIFILNDVTVDINIIDDKIENFIINTCYLELKMWRHGVKEWGRGLLIYLRGSLRSWLGCGKRTNFQYSELWEFCCIDDQQWTAMLFTGIGILRNFITILSIKYFI